MPDKLNSSNENVLSLGLQFSIPDTIQLKLASQNIVGYFIVRQRRIPITICEGLSVGVNKTSFIPMLGKKEDGDQKYLTESFVVKHKDQNGDPDTYDRYLLYLDNANSENNVNNYYIAIGHITNTKDHNNNNLTTFLAVVGYNNTDTVVVGDYSFSPPTYDYFYCGFPFDANRGFNIALNNILD